VVATSIELPRENHFPFTTWWLSAALGKASELTLKGRNAVVCKTTASMRVRAS
jgi:hypothetical protein